RVYWQAQNQPWRIEPEIDTERQKYLAKRRVIIPNIEKGIYPFKEVKLNRADVEWLLATHENEQGPVNWSDERQRDRQGLDLRGAYLNDIDLQGLPLARLQGGIAGNDWTSALPEQRLMAAVHLERAMLTYAHLEGSILTHAHLQGTKLSGAHLESVDAFGAHFEGSSPANLRGAYFDASTKLDQATISNDKRIGIRLLDVHWGNVNLTGLDWPSVRTLYSEHLAQSKIAPDGSIKDRAKRDREYQEAVQAYRQLSVVLQQQGLNEDAARFAYRGQNMQRVVLWRQRKVGQYLFSWFLYLIAGYGYQPGRSFLAYLLVISGFATAYYFLGHTVGPALSPLGAFVFSMTSFHGRGFFPGNNISLDDPLTVLAALEALVGLIIEVTFIATLTQRFFNR
ncbi:MAG: pentapeptide repeat-containing protein, partial [Chloroflexi bacterium]|nr:pentapeptide repeat-containing protein [Chloroflexota bacterium]